MNQHLTRALIFAAVGAAPGLVLVLLATFVIQGEMELTVGAPGILIALAGAVTGAVYGLRRPRRTPIK